MVKEIYKEKRVSKKTGKDYVVLVLEFENGYKFESFLTNEQDFILRDVPVLE